MTRMVRHTSAFSRHAAPEFCKFVRPQKIKRAQGRPGARCTRGLMCQCICKRNAHEHTGSAETLRPSLRNGFTAYSVLSPVRPELVCHRRCADTSPQLDTCHWGVRTTRLCRPLQPRSSVAASASIAPRPAFRDECAYAPLVGRDGHRSEGDLGQNKTEKFFAMGLDRPDYTISSASGRIYHTEDY